MISKQKTYEMLRQIVTEMPDNINPVAHGSCLYHKREKGKVRRCLIGELGHRLGLPRPPADAEGVGGLAYRQWRGVFTESARELLIEAQRYADSGGYGSYAPYSTNPIRWGDLHLSKIR